MLDVIAKPLGQFLYFIYNITGNYGLAIIIFTVVVKLVLLPLTLKQYKSTTKMQAIQPQLQEIQKRYKNDKEKLNQEMMKLYQENGVNPAGGCLPLLVQMPILISLYWVIAQPLKFMLSKTPEQIKKIVDAFITASTELGMPVDKNLLLSTSKELTALNFFHDNSHSLDKVTGLLSSHELINFNFLGLHLGRVASYSQAKLFGPEAYIYLPLLLLPILAVVTTFLSTKLSMPKKNPNSTGNQGAMASSMTNSMMYIGPFMSLIFSFQLPAGVVLYWISGYVFQIFQQLYINKTILKKNEPIENRKEIKDGNDTTEIKKFSEKNPSRGTNNKNSSKKKKK
ncbi:MAG: membrane protein insertase YidC [Ruminiclostridium sp.]|nr:membrane protein insertase YidC [Ruminiclostridium sp.]